LGKYSLADNPMRMVQINQPYFPPKTSFAPEVISELIIPEVNGVCAPDVNAYFALRLAQNLQKGEGNSQLQSKLKLLGRELKKAQKRLKMQMQDLQNAEQAEYYHACAEAIKPNMHQIKAGQNELVTTDYLSPDLDTITVPLLPEKSALQNLNHYIKKYQKAKNGLAIIKLNIEKTKTEIGSIQGLISRLEAGDDLDLDCRDNSRVMQQKVQELDKILNLRIDDSWHIYIGRKAKENDFITTKLGKPMDWWFHSRIYRGAHVLLRNYKKQEPQAELIRMCSALAAWYSQAKFSLNVPVDYTQIRYVRKPRGSAAGYVTYTNYKTCFANPKDLRSIRSELEK
jgi:predicted ribosome quality control (RQC) complex YloA/Tae2 family protein